MGLGVTVSDLHMFSHHARPERYLNSIREVMKRSEVLVLNGDIFDFKWSEHGNFSRSVMAAEHFLESLLETNPACRMHVILGNHDAVPPYMRALQRLEQTHENLFWHEFVCRIGDRLFLHGDAIHAGCSNQAIRQFRAKLQRPATGHPLQKFAHSAMHGSGVVYVAFRIVPKRMLAIRLLTYLDNENWLNGNPVRHIHFGHTHSDFEDFAFRNYRFHNSGSATRGSRLRMVEFPVGK